MCYCSYAIFLLILLFAPQLSTPTLVTVPRVHGVQTVWERPLLDSGASWRAHHPFEDHETFLPGYGVCRRNSAFIVGHMRTRGAKRAATGLHCGWWAPGAPRWQHGPEFAHPQGLHSVAKLAGLTISFRGSDEKWNASGPLELLTDDTDSSWQVGPLMLRRLTSGAAAAVGQNGLQAVAIGGVGLNDSSEAFLFDSGDGAGHLRAVASMSNARRWVRLSVPLPRPVFSLVHSLSAIGIFVQLRCFLVRRLQSAALLWTAASSSTCATTRGTRSTRFGSSDLATARPLWLSAITRCCWSVVYCILMSRRPKCYGLTCARQVRRPARRGLCKNT